MSVLGRVGGLPVGAELALAMQDVRQPAGDVYRPSRGPVAEIGSRSCGAEGCASGWIKPWKSRRRPVFEDRWACGGRCLESLVRAALRREGSEGAVPEWNAPHRHRIPLGLVLLAQGWITHPQLQDALQAQRATGNGRIGDWLAQSCGLEEERITRGVGMQWNCPVLTLEGFRPAAMALTMPKRFVAEFGLVPLRVAGSSLLYLGFGEQPNAATALGVERMSGLRVQSGLLPNAEFDVARARVLEADGVAVRMCLTGDADALTQQVVKALEQKQPIAARLVRVHQYYWLRMWLETGSMGAVGTLPVSSHDVEDVLFLQDRRRER